MGKINVFDKIIIENREEKMWKSNKFLHRSPSKRLFRNGIHSLQSRADARGSTAIIYSMWRISLLCRSGI